MKAATVTFIGKYTPKNGEQLGHRLVAELGQTPDACWLFCARREGLEGFLQGLGQAVKTPQVIGCTTDGEISSNGFNTDSAVLAGLVSENLSFHVAYVENLGADSEAAGRKLAQQLPPSVRYVHLFSDGVTGNGCAILRGMQAVLDPQISIVGGTAADGDRFQRTLQFAGTQMFTDAAVAMGFSGEFRVGLGVGSGWAPVGIGRKVTRAAGSTLYELNGKPALEVYSRLLGKHAEQLPSVGVEYPLALLDENSACVLQDQDYPYLMRATMAVNPQDGSIKFAGEIPEGARVRLTCGERHCILQASKRAIQRAMSDLGEARPALAFCFSCMARKIVLGRHIKEEVQAIQEGLGPQVPIIGFYSYGEYSPVKPGTQSLLHNETACISLLGY
jgi:hypothetical protein